MGRVGVYRGGLIVVQPLLEARVGALVVPASIAA
jgi:hypothetical protein